MKDGLSSLFGLFGQGERVCLVFLVCLVGERVYPVYPVCPVMPQAAGNQASGNAAARRQQFIS